MKRTNINSDSMKRNNASYVLETIRKKAPISRKMLSKEVGLTSSSITNIVGNLMKEGYLIETGSGESFGGRKPIMLEINPKGGYAIGVEMDATDIICIMTDFKAKKVAEIRGKTNLSGGIEDVVSRLTGLIESLITISKVDRNKILGIGLVSAGPYDYVKGTMIDPPNFIGWKDVPIKDMVEDTLKIPTYFEKDTQGAAIAEYWFGRAANVKSLFTVIVKEVGIGGGMIINGNVYHGFENGAGDIGHMVVDIDGEACVCGSYGCLETLSSGVAMVKNAVAQLKRGEKSLLMESQSGKKVEALTIYDVIQAYKAEDPLAQRVIQDGAKYLGIAMANIINVISPEMIVIGGQIPEMCSDFVTIATEHGKGRQYPKHNKKVQIIPASFQEEQQAYGGIGMVFYHFYNGIVNK